MFTAVYSRHYQVDRIFNFPTQLEAWKFLLNCAEDGELYPVAVIDEEAKVTYFMKKSFASLEDRISKVKETSGLYENNQIELI